jgi:MOSC domain-containing protein YiiM
VPQLVKRFAARGATGAYLRVLETGEFGAGDDVEVVHRPDHEVTVELAFRALTTRPSRLPELAPAVRYLPVKVRATVTRKIDARVAATA